MAQRFIVAVKSKTNQLAVPVDYRGTGVAAGNIIGGDKSCYDIVAFSIFILAEVFLFIQVQVIFRQVKFIIPRHIFLYYAFHGSNVIVMHSIARSI